jgi:hypothetical protein
MLCETCRYSGRVGFVRAGGLTSTHTSSDDRVNEPLIPCPDCGGSGIAHCCDGICEQPGTPGGRASDRSP